ncbi:hypothetical protein VNI00_017285 [Paramarasmius palmivorus]|uniref:Uncharacterized protein n=1 Tax=Paramarasmius palmivorus TaxID=297713 RepID=A0AAW0B8G0_9AGAR
MALDEAMKVDYSKEVAIWEKAVVQWEQGKSRECPYDLPECSLTLALVKKQLAEEDHARVASGRSNMESTISSMVVEGIEIEDAQRAVLSAISKSKHTPYQETNIQQRRTALLHRIQRLQKTQRTHIPQLSPYLPSLSSKEAVLAPEKIPLVLPSALDPQSRIKICSQDVINLEERLRHAQAVESLARLRMHLRSRSVAYKHSSNVIRSQSVQTRNRTLQDQLEGRIKGCQQMYCAARDALLSLRGPGEWTQVLQELKDEDVRGIGERLLLEEEKEILRKAQELAGVSTGTIRGYFGGTENIATVPVNPVLARGESKNLHLSWIWYTTGIHGNAEQVKKREGASVEEIISSSSSLLQVYVYNGAKHAPELELVNEEMRRAVAFCRWKSQWWQQQLERRTGIESCLIEGLHAYSLEHARTETARAELWEEKWAPLQKRVEIILTCLDDPEADLEAKLSSVGSLEVEIELETDVWATEDPDDIQ